VTINERKGNQNRDTEFLRVVLVVDEASSGNTARLSMMVFRIQVRAVSLQNQIYIANCYFLIGGQRTEAVSVPFTFRGTVCSACSAPPDLNVERVVSQENRAVPFRHAFQRTSYPD